MYTHIRIHVYILGHLLKTHTPRSPPQTFEEGAGYEHFAPPPDFLGEGIRPLCHHCTLQRRLLRSRGRAWALPGDPGLTQGPESGPAPLLRTLQTIHLKLSISLPLCLSSPSWRAGTRRALHRWRSGQRSVPNTSGRQIPGASHSRCFPGPAAPPQPPYLA